MSSRTDLLAHPRFNPHRINHRVCILTEDDAKSLTYAGIGYKCNTRRHRHYSRTKVDELVKGGELMWLGKHKKYATYRNARTWMKIYTRTELGAIAHCGMQMVRGGGGL